MLTMYPAVFIPEPDGRYSVLFPDFDCATCGGDLNDAVEMAVDCMAGEVYTMQKEHQALPKPSKMTPELLEKACLDVEADPKAAFWNLVAVDVADYAKRHFEKSVKKTLTIPQWMNEAAEKQGINFSQVLQEALAAKLTHAGT